MLAFSIAKLLAKKRFTSDMCLKGGSDKIKLSRFRNVYLLNGTRGRTRRPSRGAVCA